MCACACVYTFLSVHLLYVCIACCVCVCLCVVVTVTSAPLAKQLANMLIKTTPATKFTTPIKHTYTQTHKHTPTRTLRGRIMVRFTVCLCVCLGLLQFTGQRERLCKQQMLCVYQRQRCPDSDFEYHIFICFFATVKLYQSAHVFNFCYSLLLLSLCPVQCLYFCVSIFAFLIWFAFNFVTNQKISLIS